MALQVCKPEWLNCWQQKGSKIQGGQGGSVRCWVESLREHVILKYYRRQRDYQVEASVLPQLLGHPHIIEPLCGDPKRKVILLELGHDGDLTDDLSDLNEADLPALARQLIEAVAAVHSRGWVHMDVKPENVVRRASHLKLIDFGLVMAVGEAEPERGTLHTMAPETYPGSKLPMSYALDWWSVGVTIFYLAQRLCKGCSPLSHHNGYPYMVRGWRMQWATMSPACFPDELKKLLFDHLLVVDPNRRCQNATEILRHPYFN